MNEKWNVFGLFFFVMLITCRGRTRLMVAAARKPPSQCGLFTGPKQERWCH